MTVLPCAPEQWRRFSALLDAALDLPETERLCFLANLGGEDAALRDPLSRVLGRDQSGAGAALTFSALAGPDEDSFQPGQMIGPYRLEDRLGEGGMGEVWRATRHDEGPRREVALKLPHPTLLGPRFRQRFAQERDMLGALSNTHIAQLYDAGSSVGGHPYLALELVRGRTITEYCQACQASLEKRVDLLLQVLDGLSYAHQRLIVHRDVKPSNILVSGEGLVKILDFGIAKLLNADPQAAAQTQAMTRMATPAYAAPEQLSGGEITVATDVFSAGVVLFELCTGQLAFSRARRAEDEAPLASARATQAAGARAGIEERALARRLRGDLDAMIAKSIAVAPASRYPSAEAFAADLRRWRSNVPVRARRIGWGTAALKFVRRNRLGVSFAVVLALAVASGAGGIAWQASRTAAEAIRAEAEAKRATAIKDFLIGLFNQGNPNYGGQPSGNMTAKDLLDIGARQADHAFDGDTVTELELQQTLGDLYATMAEKAPALHAYERALALARDAYGAADGRTIDRTIDLAWEEAEWGRPQAALDLLTRERPIILSGDGPQSLRWAQWLEVHAEALKSVPGGRDSSLHDALQSVALIERRFPRERELVDALFVLEGAYFLAEDYRSVSQTLDRLRDISLAQGNFSKRDELTYDGDKGYALELLGNSDGADRIFAKGEALALQMVGRLNSATVEILNRRARLRELRGDRIGAGRYYDEIEGILREVAARKLPPVLQPWDYAESLLREGRAQEAASLLEDQLARSGGEQLKSAFESDARALQGRLGDAYDQLGRPREARPLLQAARDAWMRFGPVAGERALSARVRWGQYLLSQGEWAPAEAELAAVLSTAGLAPSAPAALAQAGLARIALARGDTGAAARLSEAALATLEATRVEYDVRAWLELWQARGAVLLALGDRHGALGLAVKAAEAAQAWCVPGSAASRRAHAFLDAVSTA